MDHLGSVSVLACPIVGFVARHQTPLTRTRAVVPRVRGLHVGVAPDLCVSGLCPRDLLAINRKSHHKNLEVKLLKYIFMSTYKYRKLAQKKRDPHKIIAQT